MIKSLRKLRKGKFVNLIKSIFNKPTFIVLCGKRLNAFYLRKGRKQGYTLLLFSILYEVLTSAIRQEKKVKVSELKR